jgi:hypothetical protein
MLQQDVMQGVSVPGVAHSEALVALGEVRRLADVEDMHELRHQVGHAAVKLKLDCQLQGLCQSCVHVRQVEVASLAGGEVRRLDVQFLACRGGAADHFAVLYPAADTRSLSRLQDLSAAGVYCEVCKQQTEALDGHQAASAAPDHRQGDIPAVEEHRLRAEPQLAMNSALTGVVCGSLRAVGARAGLPQRRR